MDRIDLASQRYLLNHFKLVAELGESVTGAVEGYSWGVLSKVCKRQADITVCMGTPNLRFLSHLFHTGYRRFLNNLSQANVDLIILA